ARGVHAVIARGQEDGAQRRRAAAPPRRTVRLRHQAPAPLQRLWAPARWGLAPLILMMPCNPSPASASGNFIRAKVKLIAKCSARHSLISGFITSSPCEPRTIFG